MSTRVFPQALLDNGLSLSRVVETRVGIQETAGGREIRESWWLSPRNRYRLAVDVLRAASQREYQTLIGFFARHFGALDSFLLSDPEDNSVAAHPFGKGDGATRLFQLQRTLVADADLPAAASRAYWPAFSDGYDPVYEPAAGYTLFVNGSSTSAYIAGVNGAITFNVAPASGAILSWTGSFYRRVRFADSSLSVDRIVPALWRSDGIDLIEVKP